MKWFWFAMFMVGAGVVLVSVGDNLAIAAFVMAFLGFVKAQER